MLRNIAQDNGAYNLKIHSEYLYQQLVCDQRTLDLN